MSFELPTNTLSPAELEASNKTPVYVAVAVGFVLATGGVILRIIARRISKAAAFGWAFGWEDYTIVLALVGLPFFLILYPTSPPPLHATRN